MSSYLLVSIQGVNKLHRMPPFSGAGLRKGFLRAFLPEAFPLCPYWILSHPTTLLLIALV
jgi:hypothetical protein